MTINKANRAKEPKKVKKVKKVNKVTAIGLALLMTVSIGGTMNTAIASNESSRSNKLPEITAAEQFLASWTLNDPQTGHPHFSGAVGLLAHQSHVVDRYSVGYALRYADAAGTELPEHQRVPMRIDTIFDVASISKLFTALAIMRLSEDGRIKLDSPVAAYLPTFAANGKETITVRQLLTHVSGLAAEPVPALWRGYSDIPARRAAVLASPLKNPPGSTFVYSDINFMVLGFLAEAVTDSTLDNVVADYLTKPLGMVDTGYRPSANKQHRIAATEFQQSSGRGMIRGEVHDENAWALGGVSGHAGIFSTANDLTTLANMLLKEGTHQGRTILRKETVRAIFTNYNEQFADHSHGLGFELNQPWYMGELASPKTAGHTGFTGTSIVLDFNTKSIGILLTNRVHPSRNWGSINVARQIWASALAKSIQSN